MTQRLTPATLAQLAAAMLLWAGNAVVGRLLNASIPPMTLNLARWVLAFLLLLPLAHRVLRPDSPLWSQWRRFAMLGLLGIGCYNSLQYLALQTSTALNVTLVASSIPVWMLLVGRVAFAQPVTRRQAFGAVLSIAGVLLVLSRGQWAVLEQLHWVRGDFYMLLATLCWALYSWLLARPVASALPGGWAAMLLGQVVFGLGWSGLFTAAEWRLTEPHIRWGWPLAAALGFVAVGPAVVAYRCWGLAVQRVGPQVAGFFSNLIPLFAALLSGAFLGEWPQLYHGLAFLLIAGGIAVSS